MPTTAAAVLNAGAAAGPGGMLPRPTGVAHQPGEPGHGEKTPGKSLRQLLFEKSQINVAKGIKPPFNPLLLGGGGGSGGGLERDAKRPLPFSAPPPAPAPASAARTAKRPCKTRQEQQKVVRMVKRRKDTLEEVQPAAGQQDPENYEWVAVEETVRCTALTFAAF